MQKELPVELNQFTFTGEVLEGEKRPKGYYLKVFQKVGGKQDTVFTVFVPSESFQAEDLHKKDIVLINNGLAYKGDDGTPTIRITRPDQLQLIKRNVDLGTISAAEVF